MNLEGVPKMEEKKEDVSAQEITRRSFLKTSALGVMGMMVGGKEVVASNDVPRDVSQREVAPSRESFENRSEKYAAGIREIHEKALSDPQEQIAFYVNGEKGEKWVWQKEGLGGAATMDPSKIQSLIDQGPRELDIIHTHTLELSANISGIRVKKGIFSGIRLEQGRRIDDLAFHPPSNTDIISANLQRSFLRNPGGVKIRYKVVEPKGVWEYSLSESKFLNDFNEYNLTVLEPFLQKMIQEREVIEKINKMGFGINALTLLDDPDVYDMVISKIPAKYGSEIQEMISRKRKLEEKYPAYKIMRSFEMGYPRAPLESKDEILKEYTRALSQLGVTLNFSPIDVYKK